LDQVDFGQPGGTTVRRLASVFGLTLVLAVPGGGVAAAGVVGPTRVGPHQWFVGEVNGSFTTPAVKVVCPGPSTVGHAVPGQTLAVNAPPVVLSNAGNTGAQGRRIVATIGPATSTAGSVVFSRYHRPQPFPTSVTLPCSGTGLVVFTPEPGSRTAKASIVTVSYVNVAVRPQKV
jgi:hypothetical protein